MGMRAVLTINSETHFYAQWGSVQFQLPQWAAWLQACRSTLTKPTAANYAAILGALDGGAILEPCEAERREAADLDWLYDVEISGTDADWAVTFTVTGPQLWQYGDEAEVVTFHARVDDLSEVEAAAYRGVRGVARRAVTEPQRAGATRLAEVLATTLHECPACGAERGDGCRPDCLGDAA